MILSYIISFELIYIFLISIFIIVTIAALKGIHKEKKDNRDVSENWKRRRFKMRERYNTPFRNRNIQVSKNAPRVIKGTNKKKDKHCTKCGTKIAEDALFCHTCGKSLNTKVRFCQYCGEHRVADTVFCHKCGNLVISLTDMNFKFEYGKNDNIVPEMAKYCNDCGNMRDDKQTYCSNCGVLSKD